MVQQLIDQVAKTLTGLASGGTLTATLRPQRLPRRWRAPWPARRARLTLPTPRW